MNPCKRIAPARQWNHTSPIVGPRAAHQAGLASTVLHIVGARRCQPCAVGQRRHRHRLTLSAHLRHLQSEFYGNQPPARCFRRRPRRFRPISNSRSNLHSRHYASAINTTSALITTRAKNLFSANTFLTFLHTLSADASAEARPMADYPNSRFFSPSGFLSWVRTLLSHHAQ